ncbi:MAG: energy transducer TonB [Steroidobacteraceae bacterium]
MERWRHARDLPRDGRKVDGGDDMLRHALPEELHARLLRARTDVQRDFDAGDWPSVRIGMSDAAAELNAATLRAAAIATYWKEWFLAQRRIAGWERAVRANKLSDPHAGALHEVQDAIAAQVRELRFAETSAGFRRLNELLAVALEEARRSVPGGVLKFDPVRRWPDTPCSAPPGAGEWSATNAAADERGPRINAGDSAPTGRFYPRLAAAFGIEGITSVKARVRSNGCVEWAEVAKTSGFPMLDEAALDWTIDGAKFEPARRGAAPLDGSYTFNMRFYLD